MRICVECRAELPSGSWTCPRCGFAPRPREGFLSFSDSLTDEHGGFGVDGFAELFDLEAGHFWFRSRNRLVEWAIRKYFPAARRILEVGCGTGFVLAHLERALPEASLVGGEAYAEALTFAATRLERAELQQLDVRRLPYEADFDLVGAFDVLEHVPEDEQALAAIFAATRPGGGVLFTVPQHRWLWSRSDDTAHHVRRYTRADLTRKMTRAGFTILRATSFVSTLLPAMIASRAYSKLASTTPEATVTREFAPSATVNTLFETTLTAERLAIQAGLSFPAGGSLLIAATRPID